MGYDGWLEFGGTELVNLSRTAQLAQVLGVPAVWIDPEQVTWIQDALSGIDYDDITEAPWYDEGYAASTEFVGIVPLSFTGISDSSREAVTTEYVTSGGRSGTQRNATLPLVANVVLLASTEAGAEYGRRWMNRVLRGSYRVGATAGTDDLRYFRYNDAGAPVAHRRGVTITRGTSVTRKRKGDNSVALWATFTLTANDPFEYGEAVPVLSDLGGAATGALTHGALTMIEEGCPVYDYSPVFDPMLPALIQSPTAPNLIPDGWNIEDDMTFYRYWARVPVPQPSSLDVVPLITLSTATDARRVRVMLWDSDAQPDDLCGALFGAVVSYLPSGDLTLHIDGEREASYLWDGFSAAVRRSDSLVYSTDASPVRWVDLSDPTSLLITLDLFAEDDSSGMEGEGDVRVALSLIPKSD